MKKVITTVGTSLFENYKEKECKGNILPPYDDIRGKSHRYWEEQKESGKIPSLKNLVLQWSKKNENASAEITSIKKIQEKKNEHIDVFLISTDTIVSRIASEIICEYFKDDNAVSIHFDSNKNVIPGLQVENYGMLVKEGLPNLINRINHIAGASMGEEGYFKDFIFNITGGYKAVIPYITTMAQINGCEINYIFENTNVLITIPALPVKLDFDLFKDYEDEIALLSEGIENYSKTKNNNYQKMNFLEEKGLIEEFDNYAFLSPIGQIMYNRYRKMIFVFKAPEEIYHEINKQDDIKRILKTKFINSELVKSKTETKGEGQHKHIVYDDGNNNNRIYYFINDGFYYIYKTFQSEEEAKAFIDTPFDKEMIIKKSITYRMEVNHV